MNLPTSGWYLTGFSGGEFSEATWVVFKLEEKHAELVRETREAMAPLFKKYGSYGSATLRGTVDLHVLRYLDEEEDFQKVFPSMEYVPSMDEVVYIGDQFDGDSIPEKWYWRSELQGLRIGAEYVYLVASGKYNDERAESSDIACLFECS